MRVGNPQTTLNKGGNPKKAAINKAQSDINLSSLGHNKRNLGKSAHVRTINLGFIECCVTFRKSRDNRDSRINL